MPFKQDQGQDSIPDDPRNARAKPSSSIKPKFKSKKSKLDSFFSSSLKDFLKILE